MGSGDYRALQGGYLAILILEFDFYGLESNLIRIDSVGIMVSYRAMPEEFKGNLTRFGKQPSW